MRYLNFWDNKNFWGAKFGPLTHASSVNFDFIFKFNMFDKLALFASGYRLDFGVILIFSQLGF